jgi:hypothetical protein
MNPCHAVTLNFYIIHFNIILPCTSVSLKRSFPFRVFNCNFVYNTHVVSRSKFPASLIHLDLITPTASDTRHSFISPSLHGVFEHNFLKYLNVALCFNDLLTVRPDIIKVLFAILMHYFFIKSIVFLYMFRALLCSSSE